MRVEGDVLDRVEIQDLALVLSGRDRCADHMGPVRAEVSAVEPLTDAPAEALKATRPARG
jgi:hypothetical protein